MNRATTLALLSEHKPELQRRFGVVRLALFGSRARDRARENIQGYLAIDSSS